MFIIYTSIAFLASPTTVFSKCKVISRVWMSMLAMSLGSIYSCYSFSAKHVLPMCDRLHMGGIYTFRIVAFMVYFLAFRNRADEQFPSYEMCSSHLFGIGTIGVLPFANKNLSISLALTEFSSREHTIPNNTSCHRIRQAGLAQQPHQQWLYWPLFISPRHGRIVA